jgi:hypothetical protein
VDDQPVEYKLCYGCLHWDGERCTLGKSLSCNDYEDRWLEPGEWETGE